MTLHLAAALVVFAIWQIWLIATASAVLPVTALILTAFILVAAVAVPAARRLDREWSRTVRRELPSLGLTARYRRDVRRLWIAAVLFPPLWIGGAIAAAAAMGRIAL